MTPRETLKMVLRMLDSGEIKPDALVVCLRDQKAGLPSTYYFSASPDELTTLGLLTHTTYSVMHGDRAGAFTMHED